MAQDIIPALDRGLRVLDFLLRSGGEARFSEVKRQLNGITDASLNRLLKALIASGYITKKEAGAYALSAKVTEWGSASNVPNTQALAEQFVQQASGELNESAAFVLFDGEKIVTRCSRNAPDSVTILSKGNILHFEHDHAGSLMVMRQLSVRQRSEAIRSRHSFITSQKMYRAGLKKAYRDEGYALDEATKRVGVSRLAVPIETSEGPGSLFIALPTARAKVREEEYGAGLLKIKGEWQHRYGKVAPH